MYIHFVFGVSIIGAVFLGRFCPYTVSEKESWGEVLLLNFICVMWFFFTFPLKKVAAVGDRKNAIKQEETPLTILFPFQQS